MFEFGTLKIHPGSDSRVEIEKFSAKRVLKIFGAPSSKFLSQIWAVDIGPIFKFCAVFSRSIKYELFGFDAVIRKDENFISNFSPKNLFQKVF